MSKNTVKNTNSNPFCNTVNKGFAIGAKVSNLLDHTVVFGKAALIAYNKQKKANASNVKDALKSIK